MKGDEHEGPGEAPLLYYRTDEQIEAYRKLPVEVKLDWLQAQMEFFYYAMPEEARERRRRLLG